MTANPRSLDPRAVAGAVVAAGAVPVALFTSQRIDAPNGIPAAVAGCLALGVAVSWPWARTRIAVPATLAAVVSIAATGYALLTGYHPDHLGGMVGLVEIVGLLLLLALVVRWTPAPLVYLVAPVAAAAQTLWILRFLPAEAQDPLAVVGGCVLWSVGSVAAVVAGGYPRFAAVRLERSVAAARQHQRLELAHDLHDFVAHDVSGIVAQAQAARFVHADDAEKLRGVLERIEATGLQVLSAMDDLVGMLADQTSGEAHRAPVGGLSDLADLVARFGEERPDSRVTLTLDERSRRLAGATPGVDVTAYRVVVEGLTNVRRHAPGAERIAVDVRVDDDDMLRLRIGNDAGDPAPAAPGRSRGGNGLTHLAERVRALGGTLTAGADDSGGWTVAAAIPLQHPEARGGR